MSVASYLFGVYLNNMPHNKFYYTYVLLSTKDGDRYVGSTDDLIARKKKHDLGHVKSTKNRRPLELVYYEACLTRSNARRREIYLKTAWGKRYLNTRTLSS